MKDYGGRTQIEYVFKYYALKTYGLVEVWIHVLNLCAGWR
jgi:hypothetical protein